MISLEQWRAAIGFFSHCSPPGHYIHPYTQRGVYNRHLLRALLYHLRTVFCILYAYTIVQYVLLCYIVKVFVILTCNSMFPNNMMLLNTSCIHNMFLHYSILCCQYINMLFHYTIIYCRYLIGMACFVQLFCSVHMLVRYVSVSSSVIKKCRDNNKLFGQKYDRVSVHAHCQSTTMIVHCFLYASIAIQLLLLSGDVETNPGPVTKVCPACSRSVHIRKTICDCGNVFIFKKCVSVCPKCSTSVHIRMATCNKCGYALNIDKLYPIRESKRLGMQRKRARETDTETVARQEKNKKLMSNKRARETDAEKIARREANRVGRRASESTDQASLRKEKIRIHKADKLKATVAIDHVIDAFHSKIKLGPEFVCTCCHRMMYKQNVISCNVHKYSKCNAEVLQNVFGEDLSYKCSNGKQWVCKTCDSALTRGNIPVQAKTNGFKLTTIPPELSSLNALEIRLISLRVPFMKMVALPSGKQHCIHGPAVNVPSKLDSVCELLPRLPSETELVPFKLKRKLAYKGHYMYDYVHPDKVMSALRWLKANNPLYKDVVINEGWVNDSLAADSELFNGLTEPTEESMDTDNTCTTEECMDTDNTTEESMDIACAQPQSANDVLSSIASSPFMMYQMMGIACFLP